MFFIKYLFKNHLMKIISSLGIFAFLCILIIINSYMPLSFKFITSASIEPKLALTKKYDGGINIKDELIIFKLSKQTPYTSKYHSLIKYAKCVGGDTLVVNNKKEYFCNGVFLAKAKDKDSQGVDVNNFIFNGVLPTEKVFVLGTHKDSFDSRYFGLIDLKDIERVSVWEM